MTAAEKQGNKQVKKAVKNGKKSKVKQDMSPEAIAEKRRQREEKKRLRQEMLAKGIDPEDPSGKPLYIKRDLLEVPQDGQENATATSFKIMTYNLLAQTLIRRKMFPDNGKILKWNIRQKPLFEEVRNYECDIMCFQEMDYVNFTGFWRDKLQALGYVGRFDRNGDKTHGVAIFFRDSLFSLLDLCHIDYDNEKSGDIPPRTTTRNCGLIAALNLKERPDQVLTVGTTHLFWHPFGTYERTRQTYILMAKSAEFEQRVKSLHPEVKKVWKFFAGDFNSQPYDSPYLSITSKPVQYDGRCQTVIECSTSYQFSKARDGDSEGATEEEGGNVEKYGENPTDPVPDSFKPTSDQASLVQKMQDLHNSLPLKATSLYSVAYRLVDSKNSGIDNDRGEPFFSNWAHTWRGLLDYIFFIQDWDKSGDDSQVPSLAEFERGSEIVIQKLLRMPHPDEMEGGIPLEHEYPSDHLCMIAQVGLQLS